MSNCCNKELLKNFGQAVQSVTQVTQVPQVPQVPQSKNVTHMIKQTQPPPPQTIQPPNMLKFKRKN
jgi:hypothetical protein